MGIAWIVSGEAVRSAEVLVVAMPCPLLIAAPVAFLGRMSRAIHSSHVLAAAVVGAAKQRGIELLPVEDAEERAKGATAASESVSVA